MQKTKKDIICQSQHLEETISYSVTRERTWAHGMFMNLHGQ